MYIYTYIHTYIYTYIYIYIYAHIHIYVEKRKISYFGLVLNLFQHLISPNQDDILFSPDLHFRFAKRVSG